MNETVSGDTPDIQTQLDAHAAAQPVLSQPFNLPKDPPPLSPGEQRIQALKYGGADDATIDAWKSQVQQAMVDGGVSPDDSKKYWGVNPNPDMTPVKNYIHGNLLNYFLDNKNDPPVNANGQPKHQYEAKSFVEALDAGFQTSVSGLARRHEMPETVLGENPDTGMRIAQGIGQFAGDWPYYALGGALGAEAGPVVMSAGAFALPQAMRKYLMDSYQKGETKTPGDFFERALSAAWAGIKGGIVGGATAGAGKIAGGIVEGASPMAAGALASKVGANVANQAVRVIGGAAQTTAELSMMTSVASGLEGRMPSLQEIIDNAIMVTGLHATTSVLPKMMGIIANTGMKPEEITQKMNEDVIYKQDMLSGNPDLPIEAQPTNHRGEPIPKPEPVELSKELPKPSEDNGRTPEENEILSKIGVNPEPKKPFGESTWRARNVDYTDNLRIAYKFAKDLGFEFPTENSALTFAKLLSGSGDAIEQIFQEGVRDENGKLIPGNEGLNQVFKDLPEGPDGNPDMDGLRAYAMAKRALELTERGPERNRLNPIETPYSDFSAETAQKVVDQGKDKFEALNQRRVKAGNDVIDFAAAKGLISEDQASNMKKANEAYLPFSRVMDETNGGESVDGSGSLKRIEGSERQIKDPILQQYANIHDLIHRALVNEVRSKFADDMKAAGLLHNDSTTQTKDNVFLKRVSGKGPLTDRQIEVFRDGIRNVYEGAPGVIDTLKRLEGDRTSVEAWTKVMRGFANLERLGVVGANPAFGLKHWFRSQTMAAIYSKTGMLPFVHSSLATFELLGEKSEVAKEWIANGGATSSWSRIESTYLTDNKLEMADKDAPFMGKFWNTIKHPLDATEAFIKLSDAGARLAEYKRSIERGVGPKEAALRSREVVSDYQKIGLQKSALRMSTAFLGAHINALDTLHMQVRDNWPGVVSRLAIMGAASGIYALLNFDDPAIKGLSQADRDVNWIINLTRFTGLGGGEKDPVTGETPATLLRLPKPWAAGVLFASGAEQAAESFFASHPREDHWAHFGKSVLKAVVPEPIPTMVKPILEQYANREDFSGMDLVPRDRERLLPDLKYRPYTSESAKMIAKVIGYVPGVRSIGPSADPLASPAVVENYIKEWGGTAGQMALQFGDYSLKALGKNGPNEFANSANTIASLPFLNQFLMRYPDARSQDLQDFYDNKDQTDAVLNSAKFKKATDQERIEAMQAHPDLQMSLDAIGKSISIARKSLDQVQRMDIDKVQKRQLIDAHLFQILSMAKMGNQQMAEFQKAVNDQKKAGGQ